VTLLSSHIIPDSFKFILPFYIGQHKTSALELRNRIISVSLIHFIEKVTQPIQGTDVKKIVESGGLMFFLVAS
jgi:hypothetical protein